MPAAQTIIDRFYTIGYTTYMKTAISIEDDIFWEAESAAKEMGLSRSKLYSRAILEFIQNHKPEVITEKYNQIYSQHPESLEYDVKVANFDLFNKEDW